MRTYFVILKNSKTYLYLYASFNPIVSLPFFVHGFAFPLSISLVADLLLGWTVSRCSWRGRPSRQCECCPGSVSLRGLWSSLDYHYMMDEQILCPIRELPLMIFHCKLQWRYNGIGGLLNPDVKLHRIFTRSHSAFRNVFLFHFCLFYLICLGGVFVYCFQERIHRASGEVRLQQQHGVDAELAQSAWCVQWPTPHPHTHHLRLKP